MILARDDAARVEDLPARMRDGGALTAAVVSVAKDLRDGAIDFQGAVQDFERSLIDHALRQVGGNKTRAAELLGLSRTTLLDKLARFNA